MRYSVSLEEVEGRWVAFVPALPGCFVSEATREAAVSALPAGLRDYTLWRRGRGDQTITLDAEPQLDIDEIVREWPDPAHPDYVVSAFFAADAPPLAAHDIDLGLLLLDWSYAGLLAAGDVPSSALTQKVEDNWSIAGILSHCSRAEWWYLDRLGLAPDRASEPFTWQERLLLAHSQLMRVLPQLQDDTRIEFKSAELWSPRKLLRRALWHERDHTQHIHQFRARLGV